MSGVRFEPSGQGSYRVSGELTFATVSDALQRSQPILRESTDLSMDLSSVSQADSAGLALLIEWYRSASRAHKAIRFVGVPSQLRALAKISDVEQLLSFPEDAQV